MMEYFVDELILQIFGNFDVANLLRATQVCRKWYQIGKSHVLWKPHVLNRWPSQNWLYSNVPVNCLNWHKVYQEFVQHGWYSPDQMRYFITCNTLEDELVSPVLREAMFLKMAAISQKWLQATPLDHDGDMVSRYFDKNMELFFNVRDLQWMFLDKRRGYIDKIYSRKSRHGNLEDYIRPYQVIPSCLLMYRFLSMFRALAVPETGLTFYRIWRFRLKHMETGMIFEFCDWKAAASNTFSNGRPNIASFREDALELLHHLTHPHFIMQPLGLNPRLEHLFHFTIHASAGGGLNVANKCYKDSNKRRKNCGEPVSPKTKAAVVFGKQLYEKPMFPDIEENLQRWRARRKSALLWCGRSTPTANTFKAMSQGPSCSTTTLASENESTCDSATDDSQREFTPSDSESDFELYENGYITNCEYFISNSECFESVEDQHSLQASIADLWMISDDDKKSMEKIPVLFDVDDGAWYFQVERSCLSTNSLGPFPPKITLHTDVLSSKDTLQTDELCSKDTSQITVISHKDTLQVDIDSTQNALQVDALSSKEILHFAIHSPEHTLPRDVVTNKIIISDSSIENLHLHNKRKLSRTPSPIDNGSSSIEQLQLHSKRKLSRTSSPVDDASSGVCCGSKSSTARSSFSEGTSQYTDVIEPLPSSLALYRLICLFEFNCSSYMSLDDDTSVWRVSMLHKKTSGIIHFGDYNGHFRVFVSLPDDSSVKKNVSTIAANRTMENKNAEYDEGNGGGGCGDGGGASGCGGDDNTLFDLTEFRAAVTQLLDLVMSESFCHPYGIIAGTVA